jgi:PIN domain nuclease of toxin-antitoxin system
MNDDSGTKDASLRILLDTNAFLWAVQQPEELQDAAREAIEDPATEVYVSSAAVWEISIRYGKGHLPLPLAPLVYIAARMKALGFQDLPITRDHALATGLLPAIHADPFDRVMIAQAQVEGLTLVTRDARILAYPVKTLPA